MFTMSHGRHLRRTRRKRRRLWRPVLWLWTSASLRIARGTNQSVRVVRSSLCGAWSGERRCEEDFEAVIHRWAILRDYLSLRRSR